MTRLFVSYSRKDGDFARRLAADLDRLGADVWKPALRPFPLHSLVAVVIAVLLISGVWGGGDGDTPEIPPAAQHTRILLPTITPVLSPTPDALQAALDRARNFDGDNADWEPFVWEFDGVEMVLVPAGCFEMGSTEEQIEAVFQQCEQAYGTGNCNRFWFEHEGPIHRVCFNEPYWIDRAEVSQGQFAAFNGQANDTNHFEGDDLPRENITWTEANAFCELRRARLPTETEWEYAARGPDAVEYPWGNDFDGERAIWNSNSTAPVGSKPDGASWVGALDLSGNMWEWVADWYDSDYYSTLADGAVNPTGPVTGEYRVLRGGSWDFTNAVDLRAADRDGDAPVNRFLSYGFRCARSAFN